MTYLFFYITFFVLLGFIVPFINAEFDSSYTENDADIVSSDDTDSTVSIWKVIANLFTFAFWTFGVPSWLNLTVLLIFRIHLILIVARNIWIGGGG